MDQVRRHSSVEGPQMHGVSSSFQRWGSRVDRSVVREDYQSGQGRVSMKEERVSIMMSVLPTSIQNRLPRVPSIRKTISPVKIGYASSASSGTVTPESEGDEVMDVARRDGPLITEAYEYSHHREYPPGQDAAAQMSPSGVGWRPGRQGLDLVLTAAQESKGRVAHNYDTAFERKTYVDGVAYLLSGLPQDLDRGELAILGRSLPPSLAERAIPDAHPRRRLSDAPGQRNWVHSLLLFLLGYLLSWVRWAAPYVLLLISEAMRYEREYRVSENVLGTTMAGFSMGLAVVKRMGDGLAGQVLADAFEYAAQGVSGALKEFAEEEFTSRPGPRRW
ncbi:hypothetical protein GQ53DRAFT_755785 [Thozetella sp. PMI_491]|nr:hypothetical protein GQ53DRAFT_755785 [Thozetella sp. PMI_491]